MNDLKSLTTKDEVVSGSRYRNRKFLLDLFEHIINNKELIMDRTKQIVLAHSHTVPAGTVVDEDVAFRAELMATIHDLMNGCESVMIACLQKDGFHKVYSALKQADLDLKAEIAKHGLSPI
jgi:hypothetical protein